MTHVVIFYSQRRQASDEYDEWAQAMESKVEAQPGFQTAHSFRNNDGFGVTLSYWDDLQAVRAWGQEPEHRKAQRFGRDAGYLSYRIEYAEVLEAREFQAPG